MLLANFRKVLESESLSRAELIGFLVALFIEEDGRMQDYRQAQTSRALLARLRPNDKNTRDLWDSATDRVNEIYRTTPAPPRFYLD